MNLRRCFLSQQLLFLTVVSLFAASSVWAQEKIVTRDGKIQDAKIVGVAGSNVQVQVGSGILGIPLAQISSVVMAPPADFVAGTAAYQAKDYPKALASLMAVVNKYKGLPVDWARQATVTVGDIYVAVNDLPKAEAAYKEFQRVYAGQGSVQADIGMARIAFSKKDFAGAKAKLEPIAAKALAEKSPPDAMAATYSQAFYVLGQIEEAEGDFTGALEDYLRTVTLFYHDRIAASAAQERADALRKEHGGTVVP